jgi:hypothetical protein
MKSSILLVLVLVLGSGCNTITFDKTSPDGTKTIVTCCRAFWSSEEYEATLGATTATLKAKKSGVDTAAISAAAEGAVKGVIASQPIPAQVFPQ